VSAVFSNPSELKEISRTLYNYLRLPVSQETIPGDFLEAAIAFVRNSERLNTYDYIDVLDRANAVGWSIKSTKVTTPLTWKRAKLPGQAELVEKSREGAGGLQDLGDRIIQFCNSHATQSMSKYDLDEIGYCRLILMKNREILYFEKSLCSAISPKIFEESDFVWNWSNQKITSGKEQLQSLHGFNRHTGRRWWAWHGLGENQLHFTGERAWWPESSGNQVLKFKMPESDEKISFEALAGLLDTLR